MSLPPEEAVRSQGGSCVQLVTLSSSRALVGEQTLWQKEGTDWNGPDTKARCCESTDVNRPEQAEPRSEGAEGWVRGAGPGPGSFTGRISASSDEKVLEVDSGDGCTTL